MKEIILDLAKLKRNAKFLFPNKLKMIKILIKDMHLRIKLSKKTSNMKKTLFKAIHDAYTMIFVIHNVACKEFVLSFEFIYLHIWLYFVFKTMKILEIF